MDNQNNAVEIDLMELLRVLFHRWWLIAITAVVGGVLTFAYTYFLITPMYSTSIMLYVNTDTISLGSTKVSVSSSSVSLAKSLVDTYGVILKSNLTLQEIEASLKANPEVKGTYTYKSLKSVISSGSADGTEIMKVVVNCADPGDAVIIANTAATVLPNRIARIMNGTSVTTVDLADYPTASYYPSYSRNTLVGFVAGAVLAAGLIFVYWYFFNTDAVDSDEWIRQNYGEELPILAVIPDATQSGNGSKYGYKRYGKRYSYGYGKYGTRYSTDYSTRMEEGNGNGKA